MVDFLFSGVLHRFPGLRILYAEAQIGWIPYVLERADDVWITHRWTEGQLKCPEPPSTYYYQSIYSCFFKDPIGVRLLDQVGVDRVAVRDRLSALRQHVASFARGGRDAVRVPRSGVDQPHRAVARPSSCSGSTWTLIPTRVSDIHHDREGDGYRHG